MSEERRQAVLRAIVEGYVATSEPVGSKALADRNSLGVSSATIRNDMAALEEEGLIAQPHTSAGRIPTDKGYRSFVDHLASAALREPHRRAIDTFLSDAVDPDDVIQRSVRLLSQLTQQVAVAVVDTSQGAAGAEVAEGGGPREARAEKMVYAGASNLTRAPGDFPVEQVGSVLDALEEQVVLLRLLHEMAEDAADVAVRIGEETRAEALRGTSVIAVGYADGQKGALLGALGPTRMDYPGTMAAVRAVARYLTRAAGQ